ncbi:MAG: fused response regulator/phosphatase [Magnetococcales bacterium]|nr:fused response regulator/phosphatase [Magnetococcales bacterium]MBF0260631.1 fused response regulator/phosphatase [Magnetococcales bacterium]
MKILIVDDDPINRTILQRLLGKEGHEVFTAVNGRDGVEQFGLHQPDLVLLDIRMPMMNGYEAAQEIKRIHAGRFTPIIFLTAVTDEEGLVQCIDAGGDDFLTKPFNRTILQAKISAMERIRRLHARLSAQKEELEQHQERLHQELEVGQHIFANIVRSGNLLDAPCLNHWTVPMTLFNGDLLVASYNPAGGLHIMLGDFTGHGLSAAVAAMPVADIFYEMTAQGFSIGDLAEAMNVKLLSIMPRRMFCAGCLIEVDHRQKSLNIWNGGLPDVLVIDGSGRLAHRVVSTRMPLGIAPMTREDRKVEILEMHPDYRVFLFSDGVTEATNAEGQMYGCERLEAHFDGSHAPETLFQAILDDLEAFRGDARQSDDVSLLEIVCDRASQEPRESGRGRQHAAIAPTPWQASFFFSAQTLKSVDPLPTIINAVMNLQAPIGHRERLYTILAELFSNALDHGLLKLDTRTKKTPAGFIQYYTQREERLARLEAGSIRIDLGHVPRPEDPETGAPGGGEIHIAIEDSGAGFELEQIHSQLSGNLGHGGRGIALLRSLCHSLEYHGRGNRAEAIYRWSL